MSSDPKMTGKKDLIEPLTENLFLVKLNIVISLLLKPFYSHNEKSSVRFHGEHNACQKFSYRGLRIDFSYLFSQRAYDNF